MDASWSELIPEQEIWLLQILIKGTRPFIMLMETCINGKTAREYLHKNLIWNNYHMMGKGWVSMRQWNTKVQSLLHFLMKVSSWIEHLPRKKEVNNYVPVSVLSRSFNCITFNVKIFFYSNLTIVRSPKVSHFFHL